MYVIKHFLQNKTSSKICYLCAERYYSKSRIIPRILMVPPHPHTIDADCVGCPPTISHFQLIEIFGIGKDFSLTIVTGEFKI